MAKKEKRVTTELTMSQLIARTDKANPAKADLALIRERLDNDNTLVKLNEFGERAISTVMHTYTNSALTIELYSRQVAEKRSELGYETAGQIERMLINQVILCYMRMTVIEGFHAQKVKESHSLETGKYWDGMLTSYQRRFERACESLAKVRKLLSEAQLSDQRAAAARSSAAKRSLSILREMTGDRD